MPRQVFTMMIDTIDRVALPSQENPVVIIPLWTSTQLMTLKVGSKIHIQATTLRMVGTMNGRRRKARTRFRPRKAWLITRAIARPPSSFSTVVTAV